MFIHDALNEKDINVCRRKGKGDNGSVNKCLICLFRIIGSMVCLLFVIK